VTDLHSNLHRNGATPTGRGLPTAEPCVRQRVEALSPEELRQLTLNFVKAPSLKELRLEERRERAGGEEWAPRTRVGQST
jgi:hypothetical protein